MGKAEANMQGDSSSEAPSPATTQPQMDAWIPLQAADGTHVITVTIRTKINKQRRSFRLQLSSQSSVAGLYEALLEQLQIEAVSVERVSPRLFFRGRTLARESSSTLTEEGITGRDKQHIVLVLAEIQDCEAPTSSTTPSVNQQQPLRVGEEVEALYGDKYYPARILKVEGQIYTVEWIGEGACSPGVPRSYIRTLYDKTRDHIVVGAQYSTDNDSAVVSNAMLFLSHPAMSKISDDEKMVFLMRKGVKEEDARQALRRCSSGEEVAHKQMQVPAIPAHLVTPFLASALADKQFQDFLQSEEFRAVFAPIKDKIRDTPEQLPSLLQDLQMSNPQMLATILPFVLCELEQANPTMFSTLSTQYGFECPPPPSPSAECPPTSP